MREKLTPKENEVLKYMLKVEKLNFAKSGQFGIYPSTMMIRRVFGLSKARVNFILNNLQDKLDKNLRQSDK